MDWNAKPKSVTLPPMYPKRRPSFLEQSIINAPSQVSLNPPRSNHPACMFPSNSNPVSQSALNIRNTAPQQISASDIHSRTIFPSQASVERNTHANVKGPNQLNNSLQMSPGVAQNVWTNSSMSNSMFSHPGAAITQPNSFRTNLPNVNAPQNQFVSSEIYPMQGQMVPSNSVRVPATYQGNQRLTSSLSERQAEWAQQYTSNGLTYADYGPHSEQYNYPSQSFLQSPLQKQNPMPLTSGQVKNSHPSNSALTLQSKQTSPLPSYQIAVLQTEKRLPTPYDCRYVSQTLQNTQHVITHSSSDVPQGQEAHISEIRKDFCRGFQQQNLNENESMIGNFCNVKVNINNNQPYNDPTRSSVDGVQILPQSNQEERVEFCNFTSSQVPDTSLTKEKLVKDIAKLIEMKNKFYELARKVKIDKNILMSSGCIKANSESTQNSELALKQTGKTQFGPQVTPAAPEIVGDKSPTAVEIEKTNRMHSTLNSNIQDTNLRNSYQVNSILLNSECSGKGPVSDQLHNLKDGTSFNIPPMEQTQFSSGNVVNVEENVQTNAKTISVPQSMAFESYASKYLNENRLLINLLTHGDGIEKRLMKDGCGTIQDSKPHSSERNVNTQITNNQLNLKTMETPSCCDINAKISENSVCLDHKSSPTGVTLNSDSHSLELIATCLNLWRKQPSKPTEKKQCIELNTHRTAVGLSKAGEICDQTAVSLVENSHNKIENCSQVTTLPMVVQNYESSSATTTKGTELQIAVVSPLISGIKTLSDKGISPDPLPETVYPVIKEGSVCSLQNQWAENTGVTTVSKVNEPVTNITKSTKVSPLIQKEKQNASINGKTEGAPNTNQGTPLESEPDNHCTVSDQQALSNSRDSDALSSELLQIDNICSLVEGDTSYNYQIAKIFNPPPIDKIEPQKLLPNLQVTSTKKQTGQLDNITEKIELGLQEGNFLRHTDVSCKIPDQSKSTQPPESSFLKHANSSENPVESNLKHYTKVSSAIDKCSSAALHQDGNPQEIDVSCSHTAQVPAVNEILDNTSVFPHSQLSELSKEFPYGIEPVNTHEDSPAQQITVPNSKDESCDKTTCDSKVASDQIKITILNSEQMKELFPEQNDESPEVDKLTQCEKENPVTKIQGDSPVHPDGSNFEMGSEKDDKDDVRCCSLGWLSNVYKGFPQCQCNSIKNLTSEVENRKDQCSLETNSCKQGETTSDKDDSIVHKTSPNNNPKIALTFPIEEKHSETEQGKIMKDISKPLFSSLSTEQELTSPTLSKGVKKLDSLKGHIQKGKLKFHEVTFHSSEKKFFEEGSQRKIIGQNSSLPKAKPVFCTNKSKDLPIKKNSFVREFLPKERKLETGDGQQKISVKRKLGEGSILNSEVKKMKYFKQDQNKNGGVTLKTGILLNPNERAKIKEKTDVKSSGSSSKDGLPKAAKVITLEQYLQRRKRKEAMGVKASKLNCEKSIPCETQSVRSNNLSVQVGSCGKSNELHSSSVQTSEESLSICSSQAKKTKIHHSNLSKSCLLGNVKETVGGKQPDKMFLDKTKLDKNSININNGIEPSHLSPQAKEQRKQYLNRVAFKCIERESICLTKLESLPKNVNKERKVENKPNSPLPEKNATEKQSMLEFKLCPDGLINKTNSTEERKDLPPCPEQAPMQVTGIKSSKEDWIKCVPEEKRIPEVNQEIGVCNSEPLLVPFRRLHSNPRGSLLCAMDGIALDKAAGTKRGPDELSSACITNSASAASGNDRKKFKGDSKMLEVDSKKLNGDKRMLKIDSKKLKLKGDREKLKLKVDDRVSNGDKLKIDSETLKLKLDHKNVKLKGDGRKWKIDNKTSKSDGSKWKTDNEKLKGNGSKFKVDNEKLKLNCEKLKGDGSKLKGDSKKMKDNSKKFKGDNKNSGVPSRVVYIGKLPGGVTEDEVLFLGLPFGKVTNLLMMKSKNEAFIEMNTEEAAITMVNYYTSMIPMIRGQPICVQFSHRKELNTSSSYNHSQVQSALQALNSVQSRKLALPSSACAVGTGTVDAGPLGTVNAATVHAVDVGADTVNSDSLGKGVVCSGTENVSPVSAAAVDTGMEMTSQCPVIQIIIENLSHPLSLDMLHQIFSHFGKVLKIITFTQNNTFQALLQYAEPLSAELAKVFLDSWNIFGCTVHISLSSSSILNVKYNDSKSRVYTYPDLPWCDSQVSQDQAMASAFSAAPVMSVPLQSRAGFHSTLFIPQAAGHCYPNELQALPPVAVAPVSGAAAEAEGQIAVPDLVSVAIPSVSEPEAEAGQIAIPSLVPVAVPLVSEAAAGGPIAIPGPASVTIPGVAAAVAATQGPSPLVSVAAAAAPAASASAAGSLIATTSPAGAGNCVLLVKNLNPKRIKIQSLFIIFGVYGNVQRAKIFFKNKTRALVQMADGIQAQLAMSHLSGQKLYGRRMLITVTRHKDVHLLREGQADLDLTKDYSNSHLHRFRKSCSKKDQKVFPPSECLYVSHIPRFTSVHDLWALFSSNGRFVRRIKFFRKHRDMALIKMGSVEQAIEALIDLHYYKLGKNQHLWVTFSKIPHHSRKEPF
ncbi:retroelement silencing factor 1 isoform X2 [Pipistrellus kuhlii]|uniref:retroelement silencing factor 1 isoform X2 n=1 Tax=Pipistrellus kuhlii TaxID=59472 RepID=UPI001E27446B|nr:retroelement silencing factor 1 isoform X2 [Pipistrellus kuhlii]